MPLVVDTQMTQERKNIIFVDGHCMLCHWLVSFIARRDRKDLFRFAALQDDLVHSIDSIQKDKIEGLSTVILLDRNDQVSYQSDAVLKIFSLLPGAWQYASLLLYIPSPIRNAVYALIARIRYLFGRKETCSIPAKEIREKLI